EAVYYHELAKDLRRFGYRIRNRARGDFEIEGVSDDLCERFSKRHEQVDEAQAALLRAKPELAEVNQKDLREHLATAERSRKMREVLALEWVIVRAASEWVSSFGPFVHCPPAMPTTLAEEQRQVLIRLLSSRDFITLFRGGAGTGKSFVLKTVVESLNEAGHL